MNRLRAWPRWAQVLVLALAGAAVGCACSIGTRALQEERSSPLPGEPLRRSTAPAATGAAERHAVIVTVPWRHPD